MNSGMPSRFLAEKQQRFKYLDAIRPGMSQQANISADLGAESSHHYSNLSRAPTHFIDDECFLF